MGFISSTARLLSPTTMLFRKFLVLLSFCCISIYGYMKYNPKYVAPKTRLKVMTFNIWQCGINVDDGIDKIAKHIKLVDPDVVALEEVETPECFKNISTLLGSEWLGFYRNGVYPDDGLFTKWPIFLTSISQTNWTVGFRIRVPIQDNVHINITVFAAHLQYSSYGPYAACNKLCTDSSQILAGELGLGTGHGVGRVENIQHLIMSDLFQESLKRVDEEPMLVLGDFNSPSHLDWTSTTSKDHCDWDYDWPATKLLMGKSGMIDAFRELHPDPTIESGNTWSTVTKFSDSGWSYTIPEPQDRIDFTFYKGQRLKPIWSQVYHGSQEIKIKPFHRGNDWPSDHSAVVTEFEFIL